MFTLVTTNGVTVPGVNPWSLASPPVDSSYCLHNTSTVIKDGCWLSPSLQLPVIAGDQHRMRV